MSINILVSGINTNRREIPRDKQSDSAISQLSPGHQVDCTNNTRECCDEQSPSLSAADVTTKQILQLKYAFKTAKSIFKTTVKEGIRSLKAERMHFLFG